jgi:hypothetical protein
LIKRNTAGPVSQELMGDGSLSEEDMIELMKQQLGKSNKFFKISYMPTLEK